jgi:hypothetical protein
MDDEAKQLLADLHKLRKYRHLLIESGKTWEEYDDGYKGARGKERARIENRLREKSVPVPPPRRQKK